MRIASIPVLLSALLAAPSVAQVAPRGDALLRTAVLFGHNGERTRVGVPALRWDDGLAADAKAYAAELARAGTIQHARRTGPAAAQGENLWSGSRGGWRYDEMIGDWIGEGRNFVDKPVPQSSRTGRWADVSHYAQIVWRGTMAVGCAVVAGRADDFLVCRYSPGGNIVGQRAF